MLCAIHVIGIWANDCLMGTIDLPSNFPTFKGKVLDKIKDLFPITSCGDQLSICLYKRAEKNDVQ